MQPIPSVVPNGFSDPPRGSGLARYQSQDLRWRACGNGLTCATVLAPLDYAKPDGTAITLALARRRRPASRGWARCSSIRAVRADRAPRTSATSTRPGWRTTTSSAGIRGGSGRRPRSTCFGAAELDRLYAMDASPDDPAEQQARIAGGAGASGGPVWSGRVGCWSTSRRWRRSDLDLLRGLVGDTKINYFGSSYGTRIGSLYAELYPERVGRMVLDGSVDISGERRHHPDRGLRAGA